jgi:hypothetical protein
MPTVVEVDVLNLPHAVWSSYLPVLLLTPDERMFQTPPSQDCKLQYLYRYMLLAFNKPKKREHGVAERRIE